jgi:paired amphipathic helix protein Sin3a
MQVLELLRKNPAGAIPVILRRLKQKDLEWRKARQDLNKSWKDVSPSCTPTHEQMLVSDLAIC